MITKMGQNNSRAMVLGPPVVPNSSFPKSTATYVAIDANTTLPINVAQPILFPQSEGGHPVVNFVYSPISSPFQITLWADPFKDTYINNIVKHNFDIATLYDIPEGIHLIYTYLYSITGWTAFNGSNSTTSYENSILCCPRGSTCCSTDLPNSRITQKSQGVYSIEIRTECDNNKACINFTNCNTFIFIHNQARMYLSIFGAGIWESTTFQAYLNAYIIVVNQIEMFVGLNPFAPIECNSHGKNINQALCFIQFTYPYMIYVQMVLYECWPAIDRKLWSIVNMAIDFVTKYSRLLWTVNGVFDYSYMDREYLSMYKRYYIQHKGAVNDN
jgi:hypothetical protein